MAQAQTASIMLAASSATSVCTPQTPAAAGAMIINGAAAIGGVATFYVTRRVLFTTTADETAKTFFLVGTDRYGNIQVETLAGTNATTSYTVYDYKTVTSITISAAATGLISVGTNGVASTKWCIVDPMITPFGVSIGVNFGGVTASVSIEVAIDMMERSIVDAQPGGSGSAGSATTYLPPIPFTVQAAITADTLITVLYPVKAVRMTLASGGTSAGTRLTVLQAGIK
jgi:hypothetical protein